MIEKLSIAPEGSKLRDAIYEVEVIKSIFMKMLGKLRSEELPQVEKPEVPGLVSPDM